MLGPIQLVIGGHILLELKPSPALFWIAACLLGSGVAFGFIPVYKQFVTHAMHSSTEERDLAASGAFTIAVAMGSFLGPTLGGLLSELIGVRGTYTYTGLMELVLFLVLICLSLTPAFTHAGRDPPLLGSNVA